MLTSMTDVLLDRRGGGALLTVDRAASSNAIGPGTMDEFAQRLDELGETDVCAVGLRGAGDRVFVSGGDLRELGQLRSLDQARDMAARMRGILDRLAQLPVPVVGFLNGHALGGGAEVAIACDFRVAANDTTIGFTQINLGITPAWGGIERLVATVGRPRALHLLTTGRRVEAAEALAIGLVDGVVPRAEFDERCRELLDTLAEHPRQVVTGLKRTVEAVQPAAMPHLEAAAVEIFAGTWTSDEHWSRAEQLERARKARRTTR